MELQARTGDITWKQGRFLVRMSGHDGKVCGIDRPQSPVDFRTRILRSASERHSTSAARFRRCRPVDALDEPWRHGVKSGDRISKSNPRFLAAVPSKCAETICLACFLRRLAERNSWKKVID
jgi:hypothetical protein